MRLVKSMLATVGAVSILLLFVGIFASKNEKGATPIVTDAVSRSAGVAEPADTSSVPPDLLYDQAADKGTQRFLRIAKGLTATPGAIVCPSVDETGALFHMYGEAWEESFSNVLSGGAYTKLHGKPLKQPDPEAYGCELLKPGTKIRLSEGLIPDVVATLDNGATIRGFTLHDMLALPLTDAEKVPGSLEMLTYAVTGSGEVIEPDDDVKRAWRAASQYAQEKCQRTPLEHLAECLNQASEMWQGAHPDAAHFPPQQPHPTAAGAHTTFVVDEKDPNSGRITMNAIAQGWGASHTAIVCPNAQTVTEAYKEIEAGGKDILSGCESVPTGTNLYMAPTDQGAHVIVQLPSGKLFIGETMREMVAAL